jgi:hypothetical protein
MRARLCSLALSLVLTIPSSAYALELQLEVLAGGGAFAGPGWGSNRPAEAFGASVSLRMHALVSLDVRFLTQRLRYHATEQVDNAGRSYLGLIGVHVYPLAQRYRIDPRLGFFAGELATNTRSSVEDSSVRLALRAFALGPSIGALVRFGEHFAVGLDAQAMRAFHVRACMRSGATMVSCDALGHTGSHLVSVLVSASYRWK